jgi:hypothetical protein
LPAGVDDEVETLNVEVPEPVTEAGLKFAVAPVGKPPIVNPTELLNPFVAVIVTVKLAPLPRVTDAEAGEAEIEKSGVAVETVSSTRLNC